MFPIPLVRGLRVPRLVKYAQAALAATTAILLCASCSSSPNSAEVRNTADTQTVEWSVADFAVNTVSLDVPGADVDKQLDAVKASGFDAIRITVRWSEIQPQVGQFDWAITDSIVAGAAQRNLKVLAVVTWAPSWAVPAQYSATTHPAPTDTMLFANFASLAAQRYSGRVSAWEVWNEPNVSASFGPSVNPDTYCAILKDTYPKLKAADPKAVVLTGSTSPAVDSASTLSPATFVQAIYTCAGPQYFDAVSMHPYSTPNFLSQNTQSKADIDAVRQVMVQHGDASKKIWFTEFGAPTTGTVSDDKQSAILVDGLQYLKKLPYAGPTFLFDYRDLQTGNPLPDYNYGLVRSDFSPKPALAAVETLPR